MEDLCAMLSEPYSSVVFYYPARKLLIEARPMQKIFDKGVLDGTRKLE